MDSEEEIDMPTGPMNVADKLNLVMARAYLLKIIQKNQFRTENSLLERVFTCKRICFSLFFIFESMFDFSFFDFDKQDEGSRVGRRCGDCPFGRVRPKRSEWFFLKTDQQWAPNFRFSLRPFCKRPYWWAMGRFLAHVFHLVVTLETTTHVHERSSNTMPLFWTQLFWTSVIIFSQNQNWICSAFKNLISSLFFQGWKKTTSRTFVASV